MPFTLAHPAAILPLRRFCPRFLSLGALIVGSIIPDAGYCLGPFRLDGYSHSFVGSFGFCLPAGIFLFYLFYALHTRLVMFLPDRLRRIFLPLCVQPVASPFVVLVSLLIGIWTHLAWDSFTHKSGWLVMHLPVLQTQIARIAGRRLRVCHLLWYASSFFGVASLCFDYEKWRYTSTPAAPSVSGRIQLRNALLVGLLVLPIELLHHLVNNSLGLALVGASTMLLVFAVVLYIGNHPPACPQKES